MQFMVLITHPKHSLRARLVCIDHFHGLDNSVWLVISKKIYLFLYLNY